MTTTQTVIVAIDRMHTQIVVQGETDRMPEHMAAQNASGRLDHTNTRPAVQPPITPP